MSLPAQITKHFREIHFGGNWTASSLKDHLTDVTWQQATTKIYSLNTIAALVYHMNYYVSAVLKVFQGKPLEASDKYCFDLPPIECQEDWEKLLEKTWTDAENFAATLEQLPRDCFGKTFQTISTEITTPIFMELSSITIIIWGRSC